MSEKASPLVVEYYSDLLCVWAWIAQRRVDELVASFGERIELKLLYINVFGNCAGKIDKQWAKRGGYAGFAHHVQESVEPYEKAPVNPAVWQEVRPTTSANAHLILKAAELVASTEVSSRLASRLRQAFFIEARDISQLDFLLQQAADFGLDLDQIMGAMQDGTAMAALMSDYLQAQHLGLKGSPSYVLDGGRQTLYGNVGYRVLSANIEELLKKPAEEASWC